MWDGAQSWKELKAEPCSSMMVLCFLAHECVCTRAGTCRCVQGILPEYAEKDLRSYPVVLSPLLPETESLTEWKTHWGSACLCPAMLGLRAPTAMPGYPQPCLASLWSWGLKSGLSACRASALTALGHLLTSGLFVCLFSF